LLSGEDLEGRAKDSNQNSTSAQELETTVQGWKHGEVQLGDQQDNGEEPGPFEDNRRKLGERVDCLINIGSTTIKIGSVKRNLQRHSGEFM